MSTKLPAISHLPMFGREKLAGCDSALRLALSRYLHSESRSEAQAEVESAANAAQNKVLVLDASLRGSSWSPVCIGGRDLTGQLCTRLRQPTIEGQNLA